MSKVRIVAAILMLLVLAGCGSVSGAMTCSKTTNAGNIRGACSGSFEKLSGATTLTFDMRDLAAAGDSLHMKITVSVKTGAVTVNFIDATGKAISQEVSREIPLSLNGMVNGGVQVILSSTHGISTGVQYAAEFTP